MSVQSVPWVLLLAGAAAVASCGGLAVQHGAAGGAGGTDITGSSGAGGSTVGAGGSAASGGTAGEAGIDVDDRWCDTLRCKFLTNGNYSTPRFRCPRRFDPTPSRSATGELVLSRIAQFLEGAPSVVPSSQVPDVASADWAGNEAMAILDRHVAEGVAPLGFTRLLASWLNAPATVASLSDTHGWALKLAAPEAHPSTLLTEVGADPRRVGILTDQELLAFRPGISTRGGWIYRLSACSDFPPPPEMHYYLPPSMPGGTRRENLKMMVAGSPCTACHSRLDALGASLEHFDELGNYRELDNGKPVDSSGYVESYTYFTEPMTFTSIEDLAPQLATSCGVAYCLATTMFNEAWGVHPGPNDVRPYTSDELNYVANRFADASFSIRELVKAIVQSPSFLSSP